MVLHSLGRVGVLTSTIILVRGETHLKGARKLEFDQIQKQDAFEELGGAMKSSLRAVLFVFLVGLLPASPVVSAQGVGAFADLTGTVTDPSGAALPNARVTASDTARGEQRSA